MFIKMGIFLFGLCSLLAVTSHAQTCDLEALKNSYANLRAQATADIEKQVAQNEKYQPNLTAVIQKLNEMRACEKERQLEPTECTQQTFYVEKKLSDFLRWQRSIEVAERSGQCVNFREVSYTLRNPEGRQVMNYYRGFYSMFEYDCYADDGVHTGRGYLFADGTEIDKSEVFALDLGYPLENFKISQFWGLAFAIGNKHQSIKRTVDGYLVTLQWNNGAYIKFDGRKGLLTESNLLKPISYEPGLCVSDHDQNTGSNRHYWPHIEAQPNAGQWMGPPEFVKENRADPRFLLSSRPEMGR
jgi:hypothetical protein